MSPSSDAAAAVPAATSSSSSDRRFGFAHNKRQLLLHGVLGVLVGISLRLTVFPQASMAADLAAGVDVFGGGGSLAATPSAAAHAGAVRYGDRHYYPESPATSPPLTDGGGGASRTAFLVSFGVTKAVGNLVVGRAADRWGRRATHAFGWACGLALSAVLLSARSWHVVVAANCFLGAQQAFAWSTNIFMFMDILGPQSRAAASALGNCTGYLASSFAAFAAAALIDAGGHEWAFRGVLAACAAGFVLTVAFVEDTLDFVATEEVGEGRKRTRDVVAAGGPPPSWLQVAARTTVGSRACMVVCLSGVTANLVTGLVWGLVMIWGRRQGLHYLQTAAVNAAYTFPKAVVLLGAGVASDRVAARKPFIVGGLALTAAGLTAASLAGAAGLQPTQVWGRLLGAVTLIGMGTGLCYPVLSAAIGDHTPAAVWCCDVTTPSLSLSPGFLPSPNKTHVSTGTRDRTRSFSILARPRVRCGRPSAAAGVVRRRPHRPHLHHHHARLCRCCHSVCGRGRHRLRRGLPCGGGLRT